MIKWISESTSEHVSWCSQRPSVHSTITHYYRTFYSSLFCELKQCDFIKKNTTKAKKWKATFFMTPHICSPVDFRKHNLPNSSQGREPLTQQKLQWILCHHTWPCNWLTCIWVWVAQVNEKLYLKNSYITKWKNHISNHSTSLTVNEIYIYEALVLLFFNDFLNVLIRD